MDLICTHMLQAWMGFMLVFNSKCFFSPRVSVSINLSTHSVCSSGNWKTLASICSISSGKWQLAGLVFLVPLHIITFFVLFLSSLTQSQGYYFRVTTHDSAVNHFVFIFKDGPLHRWAWNVFFPHNRHAHPPCVPKKKQLFASCNKPE